MKLIGKKTVKQQSAKFKTCKNGSNEASIFIDKEIATGVNLIDGNDFTFTLNEENLLRALSFLFQFKKQLYKKEKIDLDQNWFTKEYDLIKKHFAVENKYKCKVNISKGRFYLKSLKQASGLNIRDILIENHFELEFLKENQEIILNLNYSEEEIEESKDDQEVTTKEQEPIIRHKSLREFSFLAFKYLNNEFGDEFIASRIEKFKTKIGVFQHIGYKIPEYFNSIRVFGAFENEDEFNKLTNSKERKRYNEENLNILGESNIYLTTEIEYPKGKNLYFGDYKRFIEDYSNKKYSIKKEEEIYVLYELSVSSVNYKQEIYFGSPGTGKSRLIKQKIGNEWPRITFHPELDYQGFVGAYKPTMKPTSDIDTKEEISYEYVPEAFIKAYCKAWKCNNPYYLIIEEINRGNCAQIFGDIFQLLDRDGSGYSEYPIECSPDIQKFLKKEFDEDFDRMVEYEEATRSNDYSKMALPNNLSILATMNTSDQSLFPMDSAFKRRWEWQYVPIDYEDAKTNLSINVGEGYNWGDFISNVNKKIKEHTQSEDKQIGNRFVSPANGIISAEQFVSKVLFYLWAEIYKDEQGTGNTIFINSSNDGELTFGDFFRVDGKVNNKVLINFLEDTIPNEKKEIETSQVIINSEGESEN